MSSRILKKIIKNDAMKEDPVEIYGWRVYALACSACFGGMLFGFDTGAIGGVLTMPEFKEKFGFNVDDPRATADLSANIVATLQAGSFAGALIASPIADRWGRKTTLIFTAVVSVIGIVMQFASNGHLEPMYIGRFIAGLGCGAASMVNPLYISENAPRAIRGLLTGLYQLFIVTGIMIAFWINYGCLLHVKGAAIWMVPLALQALPAVLLFVGMLLCNESPRWLAKQDRWEEAKNVLSTIRALPATHPYVAEEFKDIVDQLQRERELIGDATFWNLQKEMWLIPGNRKRALISIGLMVCQQMTGVNAINYYAPQIFQNLGIVGNSTNLFATGIYGVVKMVTCSCFLLFAADSLGRRRSLLWTSIVQALAMLYIGLYVRISPPLEGEPVIPAGYVALVCIFIFSGAFQFGWGPVCWIYVSEIPSARLRSMNVSYAAATQWLFNFVVARAVPVMLVTVGDHGYGTYMIFACFCFSMFFFTWFLIPETKGISLEKMDDLFGVTESSNNKLDEEHGSRQGSSSDEKPQATELRVEKA
ncbi:hypothetical protein AJ80_00776 [Polytolypa hystricis UAMH7299]|uniref:Major facilitator superfamily (MFS) profile domain-containing protein n=1 Tax=Polytolypa hystricis (strain UAMH7299) TaxID=1447883 RepID=A0A2B7Z1Q8_POLH7|nr:hypothetical protein AJ80_00776 [Polytolypa hystricis UAMH7299]